MFRLTPLSPHPLMMEVNDFSLQYFQSMSFFFPIGNWAHNVLSNHVNGTRKCLLMTQRL